jgi:mannose-6-phosphate isomerase-like protein (cupin superfamily)
MSTTVTKPGRTEETVENNELYCGKIIRFHGQEWSSDGRWHYHREKDETFLVYTGILELEIGEERERRVVANRRLLYAGESYRLYPGTLHRFRAFLPETVVIEFSTHDDPDDCVRVEYEEVSAA